ncbi:MAG: ABC transporter permease subunit, partial [Planctomycetes bacterium]|nr:ABC transporter permease subunit [Planctomycetota bacterium]
MYGLVGVLVVLFIWWATTSIPVSTTTEVIREFQAHPSGDLMLGKHVEREVISSNPLISPRALATPQETLRGAWTLLTQSSDFQPSLLEHIYWSTRRVLIGFLISALIAIPLGTALALFPRARALFSPIISFLRPLPSISWVPLAVIWFGVSEFEKLMILFMGCFTAALLYTMEAALKVDPVLIRAARNLGASERQILFKVLLPAAMPNIFAGLKVVLAIAWTCIIS